MAFEVREDGVWEVIGEKSKQITTRAVRVVGWARELSQPEARAQLEYIGVFMQRMTCWVPEATLRNQAALSAIPEFPMPIGAAARLSVYLLEQLSGLASQNVPVKLVTVKVGWLSRE